MYLDGTFAVLPTKQGTSRGISNCPASYPAGCAIGDAITPCNYAEHCASTLRRDRRRAPRTVSGHTSLGLAASEYLTPLCDTLRPSPWPYASPHDFCDSSWCLMTAGRMPSMPSSKATHGQHEGARRAYTWHTRGGEMWCSCDRV